MANYMEKIAQMLGVELEEEFKVGCSYCSYVTYKITKDGMFYWSGEKYGWQSTASGLTEVLSGKTEIIKKPILDEVEKEYLRAVSKPFKEKGTCSSIREFRDSKCYLYIDIIGGDGFGLPNFKQGTMYKNMEIDREYTLQELGLD